MSETAEARPYLVLFGCALLFGGFTAYHIAPASTLPFLVDRFAVSRTEASLTISAVYVGWLAFQFPGGFLLDRYDNGMLMRVGGVAFAVTAVAGAYIDAFWPFVAVRVVGGLFGGLVFGAGTNITTRIFPAHRQGFATSLFVGSGPAGFAVSQFGSPLLATAFGWPATHLAYGALSLVGAVVFHVALDGRVGNESAISLETFAGAFTQRNVLLVATAGAATNALFLFLNSWMPTYGTDALSLTLASAGLLSALTPVAAMVARPSGGFVSDHLGRRPVVVVSLVAVLPLFLLLPRLGSALAFGAALLVGGFVLQSSAGVYFVFAQELSDPAVSGTSITVTTALVIVGGIVAPVLGGWLIETFSWGVAFTAYSALGVLGVVAVLLAPEPARSSPDA
jgi:nitrate/nitrite transporter NarK